MNPYKLHPGEVIVRICPETEHPVLTKYLGNDEVICLHNDTLKQDIEQVHNYLNQKSHD